MKNILKIVIAGIAIGCVAAVIFLGINLAVKDFNIKSPLQNILEKETTSNSNEVSTKSNTTNETSVKQQETINTDKMYIPAENTNNYIYRDVSDLVEDSMPSVVSITNMQKFTQNGYSIFGYRQQAREYEAPASGSGVIVNINDDEVIILTNNHVVSDSSSLSVTFFENETVESQIKGTDATKDLAIISVSKDLIKKEVLDKIKSIRQGNSDKIKVGEPVVAIGNALGIGQSVTTGVVSAKDRIIDDINSTEKLIQTDAAINPGNSGGALLNMKGELIGINVAKSAGNAVEGMGYAIPINTAQTTIETLSNRKNRESVPEEEQGYLGITAKNIDSQTAESLDMPEGIYIYKIQEDSAAAKSELAEKDIIISFDDQNIKTLSELQELLKYTRAEQEVNIVVKRLVEGSYVEKSFKITLGKRPKEEKAETKKDSNKSTQNENNGRYNSGEYYDPFSDFDDFFRQFGGGIGW